MTDSDLDMRKPATIGTASSLTNSYMATPIIFSATTTGLFRSVLWKQIIIEETYPETEYIEPEELSLA